jgi:glyoxylase-like metal-dependent hydrolase (beta-lactamase superfamily II)
MSELVALSDRVFAWLQEPVGLDQPNAGAVLDDDGLTVIDTLMLPSQSAAFAAALAELGPPVRRVVYTSSHVPYTGGSTQFPLAAVYGTAQVSAHLDQPPNVAGYQHLYPAHADEFTELRTRPVSHVVAEATWLTSTVVVAPVSGQITQNLVVQVPDDSVLFTGAFAAFGSRPLAFDGDPARWADELTRIREWGVMIVPGIGGIGGAEELDDLAAYLRACVAAGGDVARLAPGPWENWAHPELDAVNVERAAMLARGDAAPPPSMLRLLGMA